MTSPRPRLTPAIADVRRAVRGALADLGSPASAVSSRNDGDSGGSAEKGLVEQSAGSESPSFREEKAAVPAAPLVLVALSGGPDSLALAAAVAFEAPRAGVRAGAVVVDHGLQEGSRDAAARASAQAIALGLDPVVIRTAQVGESGGPEAAARTARYRELEHAAREFGAAGVLLGHTLDDQAETVLLGLARGSGPASMTGMRESLGLYWRPLLGIRRSTTVQFCIDSDLEPWHDPQNDDSAFTRVRVRTTVLPVLEDELGPGIAEALARTAEQLREDSDALDHFAEEIAEDLAEHTEAGISLPVRSLEVQPAALRQRLIRLVVASEFHVSLSRAQTLEVARLVTDWHGQGPIDLPGFTAARAGGMLKLAAAGTDAATAGAVFTP